ncbi:MAG: NAD(P)-binding domain-containing protein [Bacteroidia bacterium]|nr:NAD(P)-binding domain-containing protein [Bacteroidia bacterium]
MKIGVLGTGVVGRTISSRLIELGHEVKMGSRSANNEAARNWVSANGENASNGTFGDAAAFADSLVFNCTKGEYSISVLSLAGEYNMEDKVLVDISNPLDFSRGMPPRLSICNDDSLAEQIQEAFPSVRVVKTLNTMNCNIMLNPERVSGDHNVFLSGNDVSAKADVIDLLKSAGWKVSNIIDLGDITTARGTEMLLPVWIRLWSALGTTDFNFHIAR